MAILVKNYTWKQSENIIHITVPLNGIHNSKVDIFISESFLKMCYPPFLFEVFLLNKINDTDSKCTFTDTNAIFELPKKVSSNWDSLECEYDKSDKIKLKEMAILEVQTKTRKELDEKLQKKDSLSKYAVKEAMSDDKKDMQLIDTRRNNERNHAMSEFDDWRKRCVEKDKPKVAAPVLSKAVDKPKYIKNNIDENTIPPLRQGGNIFIKFTERTFPTPKRESSSKEEEIWLKKVNAARRASGFISEDLRPEEHNPQWCKDKGDEFYKIGNYFGALNAYTHGIKLSDQLPSLYANRAVTQFALGNYHKCVEDCSVALSLMVPHCELNLKSRVKCIVRRAAALTRIGMLSKAIDEMKIAVKLQPDNEKLKEDLYTMERAWEQDPDSD